MVALPKPRPAQADIESFEKDLQTEMRRLVSENMSLGDPESFDFAMPKGYTKESTGSALIGDANIPDPMNNIPLMISDDPDIIRADRRRQAMNFSEGIALGVTTDLLGLPADILALVFRDAPQLAAALTKSITTGTPVAEEVAAMNANPSLLDQALTVVQKYGGGDALAGYLGYSPEELQRSGISAGRLGAAAFDPFLLFGAGSKARQVLQGEVLPPEQGPSRQGIPTQGPTIEGQVADQEGIGTLLPAPRTTDLEPVGAPDAPSTTVPGLPEEPDIIGSASDIGPPRTIDTAIGPMTVSDTVPLPREEPTVDLSTLPRSEVTGLPVLRTEVTERMATPEETAAFLRGEDPTPYAPTDEGIAGLPAAEDVIDVEPLVTAARTDTNVGNPVEASRQAFPITEELATLPDAPVQPSPLQGEIIDYTPVHRALTLLPEEQEYTFEGVAQLLKTLPSSARRDLYNLGAIDDPMVVPLDEANYNKYLKSKNNDKSFSEFTTERNASQRPAPDFIKLKKDNNGGLVFSKEIKKSDDPDNPAKNVQKQPQSALLTVLEDYAELERLRQLGDPLSEPVTLTKSGVLKLYNTVSPQVAVKSIQTSDVARPQGMDEPEYLQLLEQQGVTKDTAEKVISLGGMQPPFRNSAGTDPTVMVFSNPAQNSFLGKEFKGVPGHEYFGGEGMIPGYIGHIRYDNVYPVEEVNGALQQTGEKFAGFTEGQSNLQSALRGTGDDAERMERSKIQPTDPSMLLFMKSVEEAVGFDVVNDKGSALQQAKSAVRKTTDPSQDLKIVGTKNFNRSIRISQDLVDQDAGSFGSSGSRATVLGIQARELSALMDDAGYLGDYDGFMDFVLNSGTTRADEYAADVADIFEDIANDFVTRNGMSRSDYEYLTDLEYNTSTDDLRETIGEGTKLHNILFDLATAGGQAGDTPLSVSMDIPDNIIQRGFAGVRVEKVDPADNYPQSLNYRLFTSGGFTSGERTILDDLAKRPDIDENTLIDLINEEGVFAGRALTYKNIMQAFRAASPESGLTKQEAGTSVILALKAMTDRRVADRAERVAEVNDIIATPAALSDLESLGRPANAVDIARIFTRHASDKELNKLVFATGREGTPLYEKMKEASGGSTRLNPALRQLFENEFLQLSDQQANQRLATVAPFFAEVAGPENLFRLVSNPEYGVAKQAERIAEADYISEVKAVTGQDTVENYGRQIPIADESTASTALSNFAADTVRQKINDGTIIRPSEYDEDELVEMVQETAKGGWRAPSFSIPTAFGNPSQLSHYMYRSFIQEAVKKGYDGVVFPSWQRQKNAHSMDSDEVAKLTYEKSLKEAIDIIRKEHPEFPSFEDSTQTEFKYKTTAGDGTIPDDSVVIRFTPEIKAIFEDRVIRRAKGGEVDLRPQKMIHSGIGAMAREVM